MYENVLCEGAHSCCSQCVNRPETKCKTCKTCCREGIHALFPPRRNGEYGCCCHSNCHKYTSDIEMTVSRKEWLKGDTASELLLISSLIFSKDQIVLFNLLIDSPSPWTSQFRERSRVQSWYLRFDVLSLFEYRYGCSSMACWISIDWITSTVLEYSSTVRVLRNNGAQFAL